MTTERTGNTSTLSRRQILMMTIAPLIVPIAAACGKDRSANESIFIEEAEKFEQIAKFPEGTTNPYLTFRELNPQDSPLELPYLVSLFRTLENQKGSKEAGGRAVLNGIYRITGTRGAGSAFQIDRSGIYLTVAHNIMDRNSGVIDQVPPIIYHPNSNAGFRVNTIYCDPNKDIALVYAPSGINRGAPDNLRIKTATLTIGETIWVAGLRPRQSGSESIIERGIVRGTVEVYVDADRVKVKDMRPFGASSGGPAVNSEGELVGIETGAYGESNGQNKRSNYRGGLIVPISRFGGMLSDPNVSVVRYVAQ